MVAERVFRREDVIRWRRLHGSLYKFGKAELYGGNTKFIDDHKQPPSYDGKVSWFRYEELVDDWVTITTVEAAKRGPLLKSRLTGDSYMEQPGSSVDSKKKESSAPAPKPRSSVPLRIAGKTTPKPAVPHPAENMFVEDLTSIPEQAHWNCVRKGKTHVLEIFAGSARFSQCCALSGLKVGTPVDIRTGFDVMTSKGRHMVMEIREQARHVILMAPVCGPWSNMQNTQQDQQKVGEKRRRYLPTAAEAQKILHYRKSSDIQDMVSEMHAAIVFRPIRDLGRFPFLCIRTKRS